MRIIKIILFFLLLLCYSPGGVADTIYQWSDPWGQLQYSKTPVPGAMVSELTELPEVQEMTEQQKQAAMFRKIQEMRQSGFLREKKKSAEKDLNQQKLNDKNYCAKLRNMLMDVQLNNARRLSYLGNFYYPNSYYEFIENDLSREVRKYCR